MLWKTTNEATGKPCLFEPSYPRSRGLLTSALSPASKARIYESSCLLVSPLGAYQLKGYPHAYCGEEGENSMLILLVPSSVISVGGTIWYSSLEQVM